MANDQWITIKIKKKFNDDNKIFLQVGECAPLPLQSRFPKAVGIQFDQNGDSIRLVCVNGMVSPPNGRWKTDQIYILVYPEEQYSEHSKRVEPPFELGPAPTSDLNLAASWDLAARIVKTETFQVEYTRHFCSDKARVMINKTSIKYEKPTNLLDMAWTNGELNDREIFINYIFENRLAKEISLQERETIIFLMSVFIIHELGHLLQRWTGNKNLPECLAPSIGQKPEAGFYLERKVFGSTVHFLISRKCERKDWSEETQIAGISVKVEDGYKLVSHRIQPEFIHDVVFNKQASVLPLQIDFSYDPIKLKKNFRRMSSVKEISDDENDILSEEYSDFYSVERTCRKGTKLSTS